MRKKAGSKLLKDIRSRYPKVNRVVDATRNHALNFAVQESDCRKGLRESPGYCPTALAVSRATGLPAMVRRWVTVVIDEKNHLARRYMNDYKLAAAISEFDRTNAFLPGAYSIRKPGPRQSLGRRLPGPTKKRGSHPHKGPQDPLRNGWGEPSKMNPVKSEVSTKAAA